MLNVIEAAGLRGSCKQEQGNFRFEEIGVCNGIFGLPIRGKSRNGETLRIFVGIILSGDPSSHFSGQQSIALNVLALASSSTYLYSFEGGAPIHSAHPEEHPSDLRRGLSFSI